MVLLVGTPTAVSINDSTFELERSVCVCVSHLLLVQAAVLDSLGVRASVITFTAKRRFDGVACF